MNFCEKFNNVQRIAQYIDRRPTNLNLMSHRYAKLHIRPTPKYVANSCVCAALRLCYPTTNPKFWFHKFYDDLIFFLFVTKLNIKLLLQYCKEKRIFVRSLLTFNELRNTLTDRPKTYISTAVVTLDCYFCSTGHCINYSIIRRVAVATNSSDGTVLGYCLIGLSRCKDQSKFEFKFRISTGSSCWVWSDFGPTLTHDAAAAA